MKSTSRIFSAALLFSFCAGAGAAELSAAVQAGVAVSFGAPRVSAPKAALQFAAGCAIDTMRLARFDDARAEDRPPTRLSMLSLLDGKFSGDATTDALRVAGFTVTKPGAPAVDGYTEGAQQSTWWGRNWWWVALTAAGAGTAAALAGGGHDVTINANDNSGGNFNSGNPNAGSNGPSCSSQEICVCPVGQVCVGDSTPHP